MYMYMHDKIFKDLFMFSYVITPSPEKCFNYIQDLN